MALLTTYSDANKVWRQGESTRTVRTPIIVVGAGFQGWQVEEITTESFSYVGMTKTAAYACAADMVTLYTSTKNWPVWDTEQNAFTVTTVNQCWADVRPVYEGAGSMWRVDVERNEKNVTIAAIV